MFKFSAFDTVAMFAFCWFINGLSQGPSWPACGLLIKRVINNIVCMWTWTSTELVMWYDD